MTTPLILWVFFVISFYPFNITVLPNCTVEQDTLLFLYVKVLKVEICDINYKCKAAVEVVGMPSSNIWCFSVQIC